MPMSLNRFLQGLTDLQDRISSLFANNSFKRIFKRKLEGVITADLSLKSVNSV